MSNGTGLMEQEEKKYSRCILGTCCIPWTEDFRLNEGLFRKGIRYLIEEGTPHLYIFGTAGEGYAVDEGQFRHITGVFHEEMQQGGVDPMVGIISNSLPTIQKRIEYSHRLGIRHFQISLPGWGECTFDEVCRFFEQTCGKFPDYFFLHYNNPRTKRIVSPDEYGILSQKHPNLIATKAGAQQTDSIIRLFRVAPKLRHFLTEMNFAVACLIGLDPGLLISIASTNWGTARDFYNSCVKQERDQARRYIFEIVDILNVLLQELVGKQGHIDGVYDKMFSKMADHEFPLRLLPPYSYASDDTFYRFVDFLKKKYPHWG